MNLICSCTIALDDPFGNALMSSSASVCDSTTSLSFFCNYRLASFLGEDTEVAEFREVAEFGEVAKFGED